MGWTFWWEDIGETQSVERMRAWMESHPLPSGRGWQLPPQVTHWLERKTKNRISREGVPPDAPREAE